MRPRKEGFTVKRPVQGIAAKLSGVRQAHSPPTQKWMDIDINMYGNITALTDVENKYQVKQKTKLVEL